MNKELEKFNEDLKKTIKEIAECLFKPYEYDQTTSELVLNYANFIRIVLFGWNSKYKQVSQKISFEEMREECNKIFKEHLTETEKEILINHFGLDENHITPLELDEIAFLMHAPTDKTIEVGLNALKKVQYQFNRRTLFV